MTSNRDPRRGLVGVDGLDAEPSGPPAPPAGAEPLRLSAEAAEVIRGEIERARGREVCFVAEVDGDRRVVEPRAVARGNRNAVLAAARDEPQGGILIHNHPSGTLEPSDADLSVAARCWEEGLGTAITDNEASELYVVVEPPEPRVRVPLELDAVEALLGPGGPLSRVHPGYEDRPGQREMLRRVARRYNEGGVALVEAGTGTGKSLAYLVPAARWAVENGERTVVSTNTINLQEQLVAKDLPLVADLLEEEVSWALVKGRGNYVSIRRARLAAASGATLFEDDRSEELNGILEWIQDTRDGSLADLPTLPSTEVWEEVRSDPDICLRSRCPHFQACFYQKSRRRAASARLLVVNHHLLFTDLAVRRATGNYTGSAVLPAYRHLILDEAHNLEDAATSHLGVEVTRRSLYRVLSRLDRKGKGVLAAVQEALGGQGGESVSLRTRIEERIRPAVDEARATAGSFVEVMEGLIPHGQGEAVRIGSTGPEALEEPVEHDAVRVRLDRLLGALSRLEREVDGLRRRLESDETLEERLRDRILDLQSAVRRLGAHQYALRLILRPTEEEGQAHVRWIELRGRGRRANLSLAAAPIELGPVLRESLFEPTETVVLSSATLATRNGFDFVKARLGLDRVGTGDQNLLDVDESIIKSPFDFQDQTLLLVPTDLPAPRGDDDAFQAATARSVVRVARESDGGIFALFTSHRALRAVAHHLRSRGWDERWPLFVQGEDGRGRLLRGFVESGRGILLGTSSFWEGVDVPGRPLRGLVIQKLPFRVPTEPVTAARVEAIEREGGNAFYQYMLPLAALRLKQGFGRLVRSRDDEGVVVLLDDRIVRRRYGAYLRDSLPEAPLLKGPWRRLEPRLEGFYGRRPGLCPPVGGD
jgi:ATP-dependent DNA helicase DinG